MLMSTNALDLSAYFERIGYAGESSASLHALQHLQALHPGAIAFENLSSFSGEAVKIDLASLMAKLVKSRRGGYCFEHNTLFYHVLSKLGFPVKRLMARVLWNISTDVVLPRTHMVLLVTCAGQDYLADVGFGGMTPTAPLRLDTAMAQATPHESFRLISTDGFYTVEAEIGSVWKPLYVFDLQEQQPCDYELTNWYVSNHPTSKFVTELIAALSKPKKRHTLLNAHYTIHHIDGTSDQKILSTRDELLETLRTVFGIFPEDIPDISKKLDQALQASVSPSP